MDKRLPLALALCLLILLGWTLLFPAPRPTETPHPVAAETPALADRSQAAAPVEAAPSPKAPPPEMHGEPIFGTEEPDLVVTVGEPGRIGSFRAVFSNRGAALVELRSGVWFDKVGLTAAEKQDPEHWARLLTSVDSGARATTSMLLRTAPSSEALVREPQAIAYSKGKGDASTSAEIQATDERGTKLHGPFAVEEPISFAGVYNKYFAVLLHGADDPSRATLIGASWRGLRDEAWVKAHPDQAANAWKQIVTDVQLRILLPAQGESRTYRYDLYAGPKERSRLEAVWPDHSKLMEKDLGFFNGIASVLLAVLGFFEKLTGNWGVAIILLTISVRLLLFPVNRKSQNSMGRYQSKMKRLQPRIDEIKKRYAKDPTAQRQEQAKLMQEEGAFPPLGGCLPMFLQIPVFIGLFAALRSSFDLRQAPFGLWIHDLAVPDRLLRLDFQIPFLGSIQYLNLLPLLMVVLWIWQQKGMPMPADEQAAKMQKMMMWMPVMMGFFLYNYAAGLSLYMITQSGLGIIEQKVIKKIWPIDDAERPRKKSGFLARLMEAQQQQAEQRKRRARGRGNT